ncbi:MAG: ATP-grasp domain-containing protein [Bacteroidota bacterium]|nr:ATP-grasp domain-containing protein [Bacteroidota bacterium]
MNVAITFNVKPESDTFNASLSLNSPESQYQPQASIDTYAEWDSWDTINAVRDALALYSNVELVEADVNSFEKLKALKPDLVFNIAEGFNGISREAQIPAMLDLLGLPYTGSDPLTLAICLDKARTKEILSYYGIPNSRFITINSKEEIEKINFGFPLIVKPVSEGSSKGIFSSSFVKNEEELTIQVDNILNEYKQPALVEEFLPGREFTCAILGNDDEAEVLPIVEIKFEEFPDDFVPLYSYEAKWILDNKENPLDVFECPADISKTLEDEIKKTVLSAYKVLKCKDWSRIDVRLDKNNVPNIIEVNPLPGILPNPEENSCYPKAARTKGYSYQEMLNLVLISAAKRYNIL